MTPSERERKIAEAMHHYFVTETYLSAHPEETATVSFEMFRAVVLELTRKDQEHAEEIEPPYLCPKCGGDGYFSNLGGLGGFDPYTGLPVPSVEEACEDCGGTGKVPPCAHADELRKAREEGMKEAGQFLIDMAAEDPTLITRLSQDPADMIPWINARRNRPSSTPNEQ